MPRTREVTRHTLEAAAMAIPLAAMTYFLFDPDAFNAFLDWLMRVFSSVSTYVAAQQLALLIPGANAH